MNSVLSNPLNRDLPDPLSPSSPPWRRSVHLAALAIGLSGLIGSAAADTLLYEGFNYTATSTPSTYLHGQGGALGTTGTWTTFCNNVTPNTQGFKMTLSGPEVSGLAAIQPSFTAWYNGAMTPLGSSSTGNYAGIGTWNNTPDHISGYIPLASSVITKLGDSTKPTWMSCVVMTNHSRFPAFSVAIGAGRVGCDLGGSGVGADANGNCVGVGSKASTYTDGTNTFGYATDIGANIWTSGTNTVSATGALANNGVANSVGLASPNARWTRDNKPKLCIVKFIWNATPAGPHTMKVAAFDNTETVNEAAFDARAATNTFNFNPSTFTTLSVAGARWSVDEIRITESFNTVIGGVDAAAVGTYWAAGATGGGTGTWSSSSLLWAANPGEQGTLAQSTAAALSFAGTTGTITASGTVDAAAGLTFGVNNYQITGGTLNLSGANAGANTIGVVNISDSATIASVVTGSNGLTKSGAGTLALTSPSSTYGGGTVLSAGTLQIATTGSLGSGNLSFQGGTLKYPAGTGTTSIDVSGKIPTVDSGKLAIIDTNGFDATFASAIGGAGGLTKSGSGSLTLSVTNGYSGPTLVSGGNLKFGASQTLSSLSVSNGATATINAGSVQTDTLDLNALSSHMDASSYPLKVTTSAKLTGLTVTLTGGSPFSLSNPVGGDVAQPT
ncbi:MAG: autotransporter-associated beta strand repeat-containing protein, partial [Verrucomicrobia bacterium]|nr:autotransporter-associated beta strand repeat-containing protein [Verrucomicrobiota bacterium]